MGGKGPGIETFLSKPIDKQLEMLFIIGTLYWVVKGPGIETFWSKPIDK